MKIGVFDSGMGGLSVAKAIEKALPEHEVVFRNDAKHVPYGTRPASEILEYTVPILQSLVKSGCQVIVVACNTVSTNLIEELRKKISVPLIAMEPMVKPAAKLTKSKVIAVCATPRTLASERYKQLKAEHTKGIKVVEPDCRSWARMIEEKKFNAAVVADEIDDALTLGADVIVLSQTVYQWVDDQVMSVADGKAIILRQNDDIIKKIKRQLKVIYPKTSAG